MKLEVINQQKVLGKEFRIYGTIDNPLFLAKDVAEWIDYSKNPNGSYQVNKLLKTIDEEEKLVVTLLLPGDIQARSHSFLTEDGLYEVLMQSRKPIAKQFKKEVKKILKQIRKTGGYIPVKEEDDDFTILAKAVQILQNTVERKDELIDKLEQQVEVFGIQAPFTINKVAGIHSKTPKEVEKLLYEEGWIKWNEAGKKVIINNRYLMYTPEGKPGRPGILFTEAGVKAFHYMFTPKRQRKLF